MIHGPPVTGLRWLSQESRPRLTACELGALNSVFAEHWRGPAGNQAREGDRLAQLPDCSPVGNCLCPKEVKSSDSLTQPSEAIGASLGGSEGRHQDLFIFPCVSFVSVLIFLETMSYSLLQASPNLSTVAQASPGLTAVLLQPPLTLQV